MKVVFILGSGHCGSTLLDLLLDGHSRVVGIGEFAAARPEKRCACGKEASACPFWRSLLGAAPWAHREVHQTKAAFLAGSRNYRSSKTREAIDINHYVREAEAAYQRILDLRGADIIVDSSKIPERVELLSESALIEPIALHLVRDGRAVDWSYVRKYGQPHRYFAKWASSNLKAEVLRYRNSRRFPFLFMRYEDLVRDPQGILERVCELLEVDYEPSMLEFREGERHQIGGNRMRLGGESVIRADEAWKTEMPRSQRVLFDACFGAINAHYSRKSSL
jgi:hypothetical protein